MKTTQLTWNKALGWKGDASLAENASFVLAFGGVDVVPQSFVYDDLRARFPKADIVVASTAGEIAGDRVMDESVSATAVALEKTRHKAVGVNVSDFADSFQVGKTLQASLLNENLRHILVISDGSNVNGDALSAGLNDGLPKNVVVTGGLAADAGRFTKTFVGLNETAIPGRVVAIGFYGEALRVGHGSQGGWDEFGPLRRVTRSEGNVLFELDGTSALEVYKKYLGEKAAELPGSALLFPLSVRGEDGSKLVRTILNIDETSGSMTFAGDIPSGAQVQFMMANFDRLIDGATAAAEQNLIRLESTDPSLVVMVSCVGRKIVLAQRTEEEVEAVQDLFGPNATYCGFYSNGELSPVKDGVGCSLHNQTMTITTYSEV